MTYIGYETGLKGWRFVDEVVQFSLELWLPVMTIISKLARGSKTQPRTDPGKSLDQEPVTFLMEHSM